MSGGVLTGADIWEWNGPKAALLSASGAIRKPGETLVHTETSATLELTMADGKMTGWSLSGRGTYPVATGSAARWNVVHLHRQADRCGGNFPGRSQGGIACMGRTSHVSVRASIAPR
jgi:hypothetical protein